MAVGGWETQCIASLQKNVTLSGSEEPKALVDVVTNKYGCFQMD